MPSVVGEMTKGAVFSWVVNRTNVGTSVTSKSGAYVALTTDDTILCDALGGAFSITLYAASGNNGKRLTIIKTDSSANAVTVDGNAGETINGETTIDITAQYSAMDLICDGSNWHID